MQSWRSIYSKGPCSVCGKKTDCIRGKCYPCRRPSDRRQICRAGVCWGSADALAYIVKKAKARGYKGRHIRKLMTFVHPRLMENIVVADDGTMSVLDKRYVWLRRQGWSKRSMR